MSEHGPHAYLSAGDNPHASGDRAHRGCSLCGKSRREHSTPDDDGDVTAYATGPLPRVDRCDECDWTYSCFDGSAPCSKVPLPRVETARDPTVEALQVAYKEWCNLDVRTSWSDVEPAFRRAVQAGMALEREACAEIADHYASLDPRCSVRGTLALAYAEMARAIRARGTR